MASFEGDICMMQSDLAPEPLTTPADSGLFELLLTAAGKAGCRDLQPVRTALELAAFSQQSAIAAVLVNTLVP